jgi:cell division inhibitor SepF
MATGIVRRAMVYLGLSDDDEFEYDSYEEPPARPTPAPAAQPQRRTYVEPPQPAAAAAPAAAGAVSVRPITRESAAESSGGVAVSPRPSVIRPIPTPPPAKAAPPPKVPTPAKVHVVSPSRFSDAQEIGDRFKNAQPVVVDLKSGGRELSRRMIDFCSGVTYALGGGMEKVADQVFLLTPSNVELSADEKRKLAEKGLYRT